MIQALPSNRFPSAAYKTKRNSNDRWFQNRVKIHPSTGSNNQGIISIQYNLFLRYKTIGGVRIVWKLLSYHYQLKSWNV